MLKMIKINVIPTQNYMNVTYVSTIFFAGMLIFLIKVSLVQLNVVRLYSCSKTTSVTSFGVFSTISVTRMKNSTLRNDEKYLSKIENLFLCYYCI